MLDFRKSLIDSTLRRVLKRLHYPLELMLTCVRWYLACPVWSKNPKQLPAQCLLHRAEGRALVLCTPGVAAACAGLSCSGC